MLYGHILTYNISICYLLKPVNNKNMDNEKLIQNLKDSNCSEDLIEEIVTLDNKGEISNELKLLERHRKNLLEKLHQNQKYIDNLDYLIFNFREKIKG